MNSSTGNAEGLLDQPQQLPGNVRTLWMATSQILPLLIVVVLVGGLVFADEQFRVPLVILLGVTAALSAWLLGWASRRYASWSFMLTEDWIQASWGVLNRHTTLVPRNRVQTISVNHGPVDRFLDLETIVIHTAGSLSPNLAIPHVRPATVRWLKQELGKGLGELDSPPAGPAIWPPQGPTHGTP